MGFIEDILRRGSGARAMASLPTGADVGGVSTREIGSDGRDVYGSHQGYGSAYGYAEQNRELTGKRRYPIFDEMRLSDAAVRSLLLHVKLPILRAHWDVAPASEDPTDRAIADACRWQFGLGSRPGKGPLRGGFHTLLRQQLLFIDYGSMTSEIIWGGIVPWVDEDGAIHNVRPIIKLGPRYPASIDRYLDPQAGSREYLGGIIQGYDGSVKIPGSKLIHHVLEPENDHWEGTSMIRPCVGPWKLKKNLMIGGAIAMDRFASGIPVVRYPTGSDDRAKAKARGIARGIRTNEQAWVTFEGTPEEGWDLNIVSGAGTVPDTLPLLRHYDLQIMSAGLAKFAELGTTETGSRAVGETLIDPFFQALEALAGQLAEDLTDQAVGRFVELNFGAEFDVPTLSCSKITAHDLDTVGRYLTSLSAAGLNVTDEPMAEHLRAIGGFPELPEGDDPAKALPPAPAEGSPLALAVPPGLPSTLAPPPAT